LNYVYVVFDKLESTVLGAHTKKYNLIQALEILDYSLNDIEVLRFTDGMSFNHNPDAEPTFEYFYRPAIVVDVTHMLANPEKPVLEKK
jgi:hypothetical protein